MSKSKGNTVDPNETAAKSGAEIVRLWTVYEDYGQDLTCGPELFVRVSETYRRIRNTMRFLLGALADFDPDKDMVPVSKMTKLDQWALHETNKLIQNITKAYDNYEFYKVYHALNTFFTVTLSATYLDILKDRLYTWKADGLPRKSSQTVLFLITDCLVRMMAPVLSFLAEETFTYMKAKKVESVFLLDFPKENAEWNFAELSEDMQVLLGLREQAAKELELLRAQKIIGSSLEAQLTLTLDEKTFAIGKKYENDLREFFIVSKVSLEKGAIKVVAQKAEGEKCVRCWNYDVQTGKHEKFAGVCPKCVEALI